MASSHGKLQSEAEQRKTAGLFCSVKLRSEAESV